LLAQAALRRDGVEVLDELSAQKILGRDGLPAPPVVKAVKQGAEILKRPVDHPADIPERMIRGDAVLQRGEKDDGLLPLLVSPHVFPPILALFAG